MPPTIVVRRKRSRSPPSGLDSARSTRIHPMPETERAGEDAKSVAAPEPDDMPSSKRSRSPPCGFDSARRTSTRPMPETEREGEDGKSVAAPAPDDIPCRKRSRSPPRGFDSARRRRTRPMLETEREGEDGKSGAAPAPATASALLPDDMLLEVFKRLPPPRNVVRCAAVCRRWRRLVAGAEAVCLPAPPRHFGFFINYGPSPLPLFVATAGVDLGVGSLPMLASCGAVLADSRGRRLLLRELGHASARELRLLVCSPLEKTHVRVPSLYTAGHRVAFTVLVPGGGTAFRVIVVLFGVDPNHFEVLVYSSASSCWEAATGPVNGEFVVRRGPSVVIGDVVYKMQEDKYIMVVDAVKMTLSAVPLPNTGTKLYVGNHWIGKTGDGRLCFFAMREQLTLVRWVLEAPGKWAEQQPVNLRASMHPALVGDLAQTKLSARMSDQLRGSKLVSFAAFCEATGTLFFVMADWVVALDRTTGWLKRLWRNTDVSRPLGDVYPCEMLQWPPVLKDLGEAHDHAAEGVC